MLNNYMYDIKLFHLISTYVIFYLRKFDSDDTLDKLEVTICYKMPFI